MIIITENKDKWTDIYNLLSHSIRQTITCRNCKNESHTFKEQLYSEVWCPEDAVSLKTFLENNFNKGEIIKEYLCDACNVRGEATQSFQPVTEVSSSYFMVQLTRNVDNYSNRVVATEDINLLDSNGCPRTFTPICIIHHRGGVEYNMNTVRHYMCDIRSHLDKKWYFTSDATAIRPVQEEDVSNKCFIVLYKRKKLNEYS